MRTCFWRKPCYDELEQGTLFGKAARNRDSQYFQSKDDPVGGSGGCPSQYESPHFRTHGGQQQGQVRVAGCASA